MALNMVAKDRPAVDTKIWTHEQRTELIRAAAQDPIVTYILVNPAIKKAMCREAGSDILQWRVHFGASAPNDHLGDAQSARRCR